MIDYYTDYYGWALEQASLLKAGHLKDIDLENLIEEIEAMGKSEKRALESRLVVLLQHLLKWQHQPNFRGRSWQLTIKEQRLQIQKILRDNPSLKRELQTCFLDAYTFAIIQAAKETGLDEKTFPEQCPYTIVQLFDNAYYPE